MCNTKQNRLEVITFTKLENMERKINDEFNDGEITLKCVASMNYSGCFYDVKVPNNCEDKLCCHDEREDKTDVKFIWIK